MKILAMIFGRAPRCHRSSRGADGVRAYASRAWSRRRWLTGLRGSVVWPLVPAARPATGASSHAHERLELLDRLLAGGIVLIVQSLRAREHGLVIRIRFLLGTRHRRRRRLPAQLGAHRLAPGRTERRIGLVQDLFDLCNIGAARARLGAADPQREKRARHQDHTGELMASCTIVLRCRMPPASASCPRHNRSQHAPPPGAHLSCAAQPAATFRVGVECSEHEITTFRSVKARPADRRRKPSSQRGRCLRQLAC